MSICPQTRLKNRLRESSSIKYITEESSHVELRELRMFQMTILCLFSYSEQHHKSALILKDFRIKKLGTLCFKYLELFEKLTLT